MKIRNTNIWKSLSEDLQDKIKYMVFILGDNGKLEFESNIYKLSIINKILGKNI